MGCKRQHHSGDPSLPILFSLSNPMLKVLPLALITVLGFDGLSGEQQLKELTKWL